MKIIFDSEEQKEDSIKILCPSRLGLPDERICGREHCAQCWEDAIEIVKQGGVSDDVCELEYDDSFEFAKSNCSSMDTHRIDFRKLKYCPYCGKKILRKEE